MSETIKILKDVALVGLVAVGLSLLGSGLNSWLSTLWLYLTYFFVIIRNSASLFSFMIDLPTLWATTTIILGSWSIYWIFYATIFVINWFRKR